MPTCIRCGEAIPKKSKSIKYCSEYCSRLYLKSQYRKRNPEKSKEWRRRSGGHGRVTNRIVRDRPKEECVRCGKTENLNYHHIKPTKFGGKNIPENIMILCFPCHMKWHQFLTEDYWVK